MTGHDLVIASVVTIIIGILSFVLLNSLIAKLSYPQGFKAGIKAKQESLKLRETQYFKGFHDGYTKETK